MKTSNIIFVSLLGAIAVIILALLANISISGHRTGNFEVNMSTSKQPLTSFKVLSMDNCNRVQLIKNDSAFVEIIYRKDSLPPILNLTGKKDTFFLKDLRLLNNRNISLKIYTPDVLEKVVLKNSILGIENYNFRKLIFDLDHSQVSGDQNLKVKSVVDAVSIIAKNHAEIDLSELKADSIKFFLQKSKAYLSIKTNKISGCLADSSSAYIRQASEMVLKKDSSSEINVGN